MSAAAKVNILHNPIKVCTVEGKYTKDNHTITNQLCLENAVIANGTWDMGINCVKINSENVRTNLINSVNISSNLVRGFTHTTNGVQNFSPTIASFFLKIGGSNVNQAHALYDMSPIKWFTITNPSTFIDLKIDFWPPRSLAEQLQVTGDSDSYILNFQIDVYFIRMQ